MLGRWCVDVLRADARAVRLLRVEALPESDGDAPR
jgi:hypothetical protein